MSPKFLTLTITLSTFLFPANSSQAFDDLLAKVPPAANALVLIDVEETLKSPLATKDGWGKELEMAYVERPVFLPPESTKLVMAASVSG